LSFWGHNGGAKPKPVVMLEDGRIAVLCSRAKLVDMQPGMASTNEYSETRVVIINPKPNGKTGMIAGFTSWKSLSYVLSQSVVIPQVEQQKHIQMQASGNTLVIFNPPTQSTLGSLCTVDSVTGNVKPYVLILHLYQGFQNYVSDNFPRFGNVSLCVHGGMIHLLEFNGTVLLVRRYSMDCVYKDTTEIDVGTTADAGLHTVHSVQSTNAGILVSLLYRQGGKTRHSLVMLDAKPVEPVTPAIPTPEQEVLDFAKPRLSAEKYNAIYEVLR